MSGTYEGFYCVESYNMDCKKAWCYHLNPAAVDDCPFEKVGFGELLFAVYTHGQIVSVADPEMQGNGNLSSIRGFISKFVSEQPTPNDNVRISCSKQGSLFLSLSTTEKTLNQMDGCSYVLVNVSYDNFEPEKGPDCVVLSKTLLTANVHQAFQDPFPFEIKKLDQNRMEKLYPKADIKQYAKTRLEGGGHYMRNVLVVLKFSRNCCKIDGAWITRQIVMGKEVLANGVPYDFVIKASGKEIPCHKIYLAGRSPVFARMLMSNMVEAQKGTLIIEDSTSEGVEGFLKYLYTGCLIDAKKNMTLALEMLCIGHKYEISDLEGTCKKILESTESKLFNAVTAFKMYGFCGNVYRLLPLQLKAVRILKENSKKFKETGEIGTLIESIDSGNDQKAFSSWICDGVGP